MKFVCLFSFWRVLIFFLHSTLFFILLYQIWNIWLCLSVHIFSSLSLFLSLSLFITLYRILVGCYRQAATIWTRHSFVFVLKLFVVGWLLLLFWCFFFPFYYCRGIVGKMPVFLVNFYIEKFIYPRVCAAWELALLVAVWEVNGAI